MIPSRLLITLAVVLTLPLLLGNVQDVFADSLPVFGGLDVSGRTLADLALLANLALATAAAVDIFISGSPLELEIERNISDVLSVGTRNPARADSDESLPFAINRHNS